MSKNNESESIQNKPIQTVTKDISLRIGRLNAIYASVLSLRNFEIQNLNVRNSFILTINVGLFAYAAGKDLIVLPLFGIAVSLLQIHMAAGAKFWQEAWEIKLFNVERDLYKVYQQENQGKNADPFVHLFTPNPQEFDHGENIYRDDMHQLFRAYEQELKTMVRSRLSKINPVDYLIACKFSVGRTPIYLGILILIFWITLFIVGLLKQ